MNCMLLTQRVGEISGSELCQTRLMGMVEMQPDTRAGVEGTRIKVMIVAESAVFVPTRDRSELSRRKAEIVGELADHALQAVSEVGIKDSVEQRMMRAMLNDQSRGLSLRKAPGLRDLVFTGYIGDPNERVVGASMALGQALRDGTVSALQDVPEPSSDEVDDSYGCVQSYVERTMASLGEKLEVGERPPPPPPLCRRLGLRVR